MRVLVSSGFNTACRSALSSAPKLSMAATRAAGSGSKRMVSRRSSRALRAARPASGSSSAARRAGRCASVASRPSASSAARRRAGSGSASCAGTKAAAISPRTPEFGFSAFTSPARGAPVTASVARSPSMMAKRPSAVRPRRRSPHASSRTTAPSPLAAISVTTRPMLWREGFTIWSRLASSTVARSCAQTGAANSIRRQKRIRRMAGLSQVTAGAARGRPERHQ